LIKQKSKQINKL